MCALLYRRGGAMFPSCSPVRNDEVNRGGLLRVSTIRLVTFGAVAMGRNNTAHGSYSVAMGQGANTTNPTGPPNHATFLSTPNGDGTWTTSVGGHGKPNPGTGYGFFQRENGDFVIYGPGPDDAGAGTTIEICPSNHADRTIERFDGNTSTTSTAKANNFIIPHPEHEGKMLRHACIEAPTRGTNIYEYQLEATEPNQTTKIALPSYFKHINGRPRVYVTPKNVLSTCCGDVDAELIHAIILTEKPGIFNVMVTGVSQIKPGAVKYAPSRE